jgi:hypothetical protein
MNSPGEFNYKAGDNMRLIREKEGMKKTSKKTPKNNCDKRD